MIIEEACVIGALYEECFQSVCLRRIERRKVTKEIKKRKKEYRGEGEKKSEQDSFKTCFFVLFVLFDYSNLIVRVELTKSIKETQ